jgi:branched-chain amino acid transport system substrate-binding protein
VTTPASEVYADVDVLFVTPSGADPKAINRRLWYAFRACGRDDQQGELWADLALGDLEDKTIAGPGDIAYDARGDRATIGSVRRLWKKRPGGKIVFEQTSVGRRDGETAPRHDFAEHPR